MPTRKPLGPWSHRMWATITRRRDWSAAAFIEFADDAYNVHIDPGALSRVISGQRKTDADLLPILAEFLGTDGPRLVYSPYLRENQIDPGGLAPLADAPTLDISQGVLRATADLGRLSAQLMQARDPSSPGGVELSHEELAQLAQLASQLEADAAELSQHIAALRDARSAAAA